MQKKNKIELKQEKVKHSFSPFMKIDGEIKLDSNYTDNFSKINYTEFDTTTYIINVSDSNDLKVPFVVDTIEKKFIKKVYSGKRINIAFTGVDSRIGERYRHADANHIISIIPEKKLIEIISIPRDTYAFAGFEEDSLDKYNLLTNVLGREGRRAYLNELARIAEIDKIHYFVEIGFSQAIGLIEKLGFSQAKNTLQMLRDRKNYRVGDYQRTYNQGLFIKKSLVKANSLFQEENDYLVTFFLNLVETNISIDDFKKIQDDLKYLVVNDENIINFVKPDLKIKFEEIDLYNNEIYNELLSQYDTTVYDNTSEFVAGRLLEILDDVEEKSSQTKVNKLKRYFEQRAWLQISDLRIRNVIKDRFKDILAQAYTELGKYKNAQEVINIDYF